MITQCANPDCSAPLHYLRGGRLFRFDLRPPLHPCRDVPKTICSAKPAQASVFFWLCESCSRRFSLRFSLRQGLELIPALPVRGALTRISSNTAMAERNVQP